MMLFQSPIVWLLRVRKRKGYGVHSPFAFAFVTDVLYNNEQYYAYEKMDSGLRWWHKGRLRRVQRLLFRLANYRQPVTLYSDWIRNKMQEALKYGANVLEMRNVADGIMADMIVAEAGNCHAMQHVGHGTMAVFMDIHKHRSFWKKVREDDRITVTFDLYDVGIAFARNDLNKQHYIINW